MTTPELLALIENSGGHLEISADGHLRALRVPPEFHAAVREHQDALITLLQERAKPRSSPFLIPAEELAAAQARYQQAQAAKAAPATFTYRPRTPAQHNTRERQTWRSSLGVAVESDPEIEDVDEDSAGQSPKSKVGPNTPCIDCGCPRQSHHISPEPHTIDGEHAFYCVTTHCAAMKWVDGHHVDCDCPRFRAHETDVPKFTRPRVGPYDRCANPACGHWKIDHCTKKKPGAVNRLKPGELAYRILQKAAGLSYGCKHFSLTNDACQCDSTSCAATPDSKNFCECEKFINPWLKPKTKTATRKRTPRKPAVVSLAVAATEGIPENVLAGEPVRPRKSRKKKSAFVTGAGEIFPPAVEVNP